MSIGPIARGDRRLLPVAVFLVVGAVYLVTVSDVSSTDCVGASLAAWHLVSTGSPALNGFDLEAALGFAVTPGDIMGIQYNAAGDLVVHRSPGVVAAAVPAYLLAGTGSGPADFSSTPAALFAAVLTALTVTLAFSYAQRRLGTRTGLLAAGALAFTTPLWSVAADAMWTHTLTTLGIVGMVWASDRRIWWAVGLFGAIGLWGRVHVVLVVALLGLGLAWSRRSPRIALTIGVVSATGLGLASLWTHWWYQSWIPTGGYRTSVYADIVATRGVTDSLLSHLGMWFSPYSGIFVWTPAMALLLPAIVRGWRTAPDHARWVAVGGLAYSTVQAQMTGFTGGDAFFGYRLGLEVMVSLGPLCLHALAHLSPLQTRLLPALVAAQLFVFSLGAGIDGFMNSTGNPWTDNAFALAANQVPALWAALVLAMVAGTLLRRSKFMRADPRTGATEPRVDAPTTA
ncbi:hypothetical protein [Nocardioides solisilvae]|uniref:hypothetical protein n=1 Tax=Nocardioides solisilvae TaxID=1542435 RepID=UPI000D74D2FE|nr:hypothetical protein [Nocardioides solisilvae]